MPGLQQNKLRMFAAFVAVYFVWGTTYLAIKYAIESIPPFMMMGIRSLAAGAVLYSWGCLRGDKNVTKKELPSLVIIGILFFLIGHGVLAWAQKTVPSGIAALLIASEPIIISLFEPLFTKEHKVSKQTMLGMLVGITGIVILVLPQGFDFKNADILGSFGIIIAASSWASGAIYARVARIPSSPLITGGIQLLSGGVFLIVVSSLLGEWSGFSFSEVTIRSWSGLAYLILFGSIVTFSAFTWLLTVTSATRISTHTFVNPIIAVIVGWIFGGESLTGGMFIAGALIFISVYLVLFRKPGSAKVTDKKAIMEETMAEP